MGDLPVDSVLRKYIGPDQMSQILDQFQNWRGNVNAGGHNLSNVDTLSAVNATISGALSLTSTLTLNASQIITSGNILQLNNNSNSDAYQIYCHPSKSLRVDFNAVTQLTLSGQGATSLSLKDAFVASSGVFRISPQPTVGEGGELSLADYDNTSSWTIDNVVAAGKKTLRFFRGAVVIFTLDDTGVMQWLTGGVLRTVTRDPSTGHMIAT